MASLPFAVIPAPLGTVASGNETVAKPASHLGEFEAPGMTWRSDGEADLWARGDFGQNRRVDFAAMLQANAQPGTTIRLRLGTTQAEVDGGSAPYDSGPLDFIDPVIDRSDRLFGSHLELPGVETARWWRVDIGGHVGDFEASTLVLGERLTPATWYSPGWSMGVEDLGETDIGRFGVADKQTGLIFRTFNFRMGWLSEADLETKFRPLIEKLGHSGVALWCFDPSASIYRQGKTFFGRLRGALVATHSRNTPSGIRYEQEFDILCMLVRGPDVIGLPVAGAAPVISGDLYPGQTLGVSTGSWAYADSFTYQWYRAGAAIVGATSDEYTLTGYDTGAEIHAVVTAHNANGFASSESGPVDIWEPADLTSYGANWNWYSVSDATKVFSDTAGTTQAVADGAVARVDDKSGNALNLTQATAGEQPTLRVMGTDRYLDLESVDSLLSAATKTFGTPSYLFLAFSRSAEGNGFIFGLTLNSGNAHRIHNMESGNAITTDCQGGGVTLSEATGGTDTAPLDTAVVAVSAVTNGTTRLSIDGVEVAADSNDYTGSTSIAGLAMSIGSASIASGGTGQTAMRFREAIFIKGTVSAMLETAIVEYLKTKLPPVSLDSFFSNRIIQRVSGQAVVPLRGTTTGTGPIQVRVLEAGTSTEVVGWTTVDSSVTSGIWEGNSPAVPQGGMYDLELRDQSIAGVVVTRRNWGVGAIVYILGQSLARDMWITGGGSLSADARTRLWERTRGWSLNTGAGGIALANQLETLLDVPIGLVNSAEGGTAIGAWDSAGDTEAARAITELRKATRNNDTSLAGDCELVYWDQGPTDAVLGTPKATYKTAIGNVRAWTLAETGRAGAALPFGVIILGNISDAAATDATTDAIRQAQLEYVAENAASGVVFAASAVDMVRTDDFHWTGPYYERIGRRAAQAFAKAAGVATLGGKGPTVTSASRVVGTAVVNVTIAHNGVGTALEEPDGTTDGAGLTGWRVLVNGTPATIDLTAIASATQVNLTLSAAPATGDTVVLDYQYGENPDIAKVLYDDTSPGGDTLGLPLTPTTGQVSVTVVDGPELLTAPPTVTAGWTDNGNGTYTHASGGGTSGLRWTGLTLVAGAVYRGRFTMTGYSAGQLREWLIGGTNVGGATATANGTFSFDFTALAGNNEFALVPSSPLVGTASAASLRRVG